MLLNLTNISVCTDEFQFVLLNNGPGERTRSVTLASLGFSESMGMGQIKVKDKSIVKPLSN